MSVTSKGHVTIPQRVREQARLYRQSEVSFEVPPNGDVLTRAVASSVSPKLRAFERARGSANATAFTGMGTDELMEHLRG